MNPCLILLNLLHSSRKCTSLVPREAEHHTSCVTPTLFYSILFYLPMGLWLKAVTEPNSAKPTAIAEWARAESTGKYGNVRFFDTGI